MKLTNEEAVAVAWLSHKELRDSFIKSEAVRALAKRAAEHVLLNNPVLYQNMLRDKSIQRVPSPFEKPQVKLHRRRRTDRRTHRRHR